MCVICIKPAGVELPDTYARASMWLANPDGAGLMYAYRGKVWIEKGFMTWTAMEERLARLALRMDLSAIPVVLHYRITTHGGTCPENTHPFPVCARARTLHALRTCTDLGLAHNGIINAVKPRPGFSDTAEYVATRLARLPRDFTTNAETLAKITGEIGWSRLALLDGRGHITRVGAGWMQESGCWYSNSYWRVLPAPRPVYTPVYRGSFDAWDNWLIDTDEDTDSLPWEIK